MYILKHPCVLNLLDLCACVAVVVVVVVVVGKRVN